MPEERAPPFPVHRWGGQTKQIQMSDTQTNFHFRVSRPLLGISISHATFKNISTNTVLKVMPWLLLCGQLKWKSKFKV